MILMQPYLQVDKIQSHCIVNKPYLL
jgi:hypothetical protein